MANEYEHKENYIDGKIQLRFSKRNVPLTGTPDEVRTYFEIAEGSKDLDLDFLRYALRRQRNLR